MRKLGVNKGEDSYTAAYRFLSSEGARPPPRPRDLVSSAPSLVCHVRLVVVAHGNWFHGTRFGGTSWIARRHAGIAAESCVWCTSANNPVVEESVR